MIDCCLETHMLTACGAGGPALDIERGKSRFQGLSKGSRSSDFMP